MICRKCNIEEVDQYYIKGTICNSCRKKQAIKANKARKQFKHIVKEVKKK